MSDLSKEQRFPLPNQDPDCEIHKYRMGDGRCSCLPDGQIFGQTAVPSSNARLMTATLEYYSQCGKSDIELMAHELLVRRAHETTGAEVAFACGHTVAHEEDCPRCENERLLHQRDAWEQSAAQFCRNEQYYRDIVDRVGATLGPEAYTCDDGTIVPEVLRAKVAEIVERRAHETNGKYPEYTDAIGSAGEQYVRSVAFQGQHHLPALFRWSELWDAMNKAASSLETTDDFADDHGSPIVDDL